MKVMYSMGTDVALVLTAETLGPKAWEVLTLWGRVFPDLGLQEGQGVRDSLA